MFAFLSRMGGLSTQSRKSREVRGARTQRKRSARSPVNRRPLTVEALEIRELLSNDLLGSSARPEKPGVVAAAVGDRPVIWGVDGTDGQLFSITSSTIDAGAAAAGFVSYGRLKLGQAGSGSLRNVGPGIESMALDADGVAYFGFSPVLKLSGRTRSAAPVLFKFDLDDATATGTNVLQVVDSIRTPFKFSSRDHLTGLAFHPQTGELYALLSMGSGKETDQLLIISPNDAQVVANLGRIKGLGRVCGACEDITFDPSGRLFVTDDRDDRLVELNPTTGKIVALIDRNERGGLSGLGRSFSVTSLAWNDQAGQLIGFDDASNQFVQLSLDNGDNRSQGKLMGLTDVEALARVTTVIDMGPPVIDATLAHDTARGGSFNSDRITSDPTVRGSVTDENSLRAVMLTLPALSAGPFDITDLVDAADGSFTLDRTTVEHLIGGALADGSYNYRLQATDQFGKASDFVDVLFTLDAAAPAQPASLSLTPDSDSGASQTDGITNITALTVTGNAEAGTLVELFRNGESAGQVNVQSPWQISIGPLGEGRHTFNARATDVAGNVSDLSAPFVVELDESAPEIAGFGLSLGSDTGGTGDGTTSDAVVTLTGRTEVNVPLLLEAIGRPTLATGTGLFQFPNVALQLGDNTFTLTVTDLAGNSRDETHVVTREPALGDQNAVLAWNQVALEAIRFDASTPLYASRALAMVSVAVYDAVSAIEGTPAFLVAKTAEPGTVIEAAIASAAHRVLSYLYPGQQSFLDGQFQTARDAIPDGSGEDRGVALGRSIADDVILIRSSDGWDDFVDYASGGLPGDWQPTAPMFDPALLPQWADLTPFAMTSPDQFLPGGPPALESQEYADAFNDVKLLGRATGSTRTADQTQIALFWADGSGTFTPAGHWNAIAGLIAQQRGNSVSANARLFAELNVTMADAAIVAWNAKYTFDFWRPITAIQQADRDGNVATIADTEWTSLLITPPFPEYISGHSAFSGAGAEILNAVFGDNIPFTIGSPGLLGVERSFDDFDAAAAEAGRSRIYGGIHYEFSNVDAQAAGRALAQHVLDRFAVATDIQPPTIIIESPAPGRSDAVDNENITVTGRVLDNLSGVATLQFQLDGGPPTDLTFTVEGAFTRTVNLPLDGSAQDVHSLRFFATDRFGNAATPVNLDFTLDTLAPVITLASPTNNQTIDVSTFASGRVDATGSAVVRLSYAFDGGAAVPLQFDPLTGGFDQFMDLSKISTGAHTLTVNAMDAAGNTANVTVDVNLAAFVPFTIQSVTPDPGSNDVGSTFRPQVFFTRAVNPATLSATNFYATDTTGAKIPATIVPAMDGSFAWLFFTSPMPGASTITVHVEGDTILAAAGVQPLDADNDGTPGGNFTYHFSTVSSVPLAGTTLSGRVMDPGADLKPMTFDDIRTGADGMLHSADDVFLNPIAGVKVFILGLEDQFVFTDAQGNFTFPAVPSGNVKLALDGRTATNAPSGIFFPEMVMELELAVGQANTVMGTMGTTQEKAANLDRPEVYLPRLQTSMLKPVSTTQPTTIHVDALSAPTLTAEQAQLLSITVAPGSALGADGRPVANAQVGISTVPPELIRDMLPAGLAQVQNTITIQAPGVARFSVPVQLSFPNIYDVAPGEQEDFFSFDHATGRIVLEGTATISADGKFAVTDPGMGITKPGWHFTDPSGCNDGNAPPPSRPSPSPASARAFGPALATVTVPPQTLLILDDTGTRLSRLEFGNPAVLGTCQAGPASQTTPVTLPEGAIRVSIRVNGPLAKFMKPAPNSSQPMTDSDFVLSDPTTQGGVFEPIAKSFDEMFGANGLGNIEHPVVRDQLYGAKITVTKETVKADGTFDTEVRTFYVYRWVAAVALEPNGGAAAIQQDRAAFFRTLADGARGFVRSKTVDLFLPTSVTTTFTGSTSEFTFNNPSGGTAVWKFDPTTASSLTRTAPVTIQADGVTVGQAGQVITAAGLATAPARIDLNREQYKEELRRVLDHIELVAFGSPTGLAYVNGFNPSGFPLDFSAASQGFINEFAAFLPGAIFTPVQLETFLEAQTTAMEQAVQADYAQVNGAVQGYTFVADGDVTIDWTDITNGSGSVGLTGGNLDRNTPFLQSALASGAFGAAGKQYALANGINLLPQGTSIVAVPRVIGFNAALVGEGPFRRPTTFAETVANVVSHELAHTFSLNDAYDSNKQNVYPNDLLGVFGRDNPKLRWAAEHQQLLRAAVGIEDNTDLPITAGLQLYKKNFNQPHGSGILQDVELAPTAQLRVTQVGAPVPPGGAVSFPDAGADGTGGLATTRSLTLTNAGSLPLTLTSVQLSDGGAGFSLVGPDLAGHILQPGELVTLTVQFDPAAIGTLTDVLTLRSNAAATPVYEVNLSGPGIAAAASVELAPAASNNLGGMRLSDSTASRSDVFTITNRGAADLVLSDLATIEGGNEFGIIGFGGGPVTLATGESLTLGLTYNASALGLQRGIFELTTNDPASPKLRLGGVGTGVRDDGVLAAEVGNDYVALQIGSGQPLRTLSSETGRFSFNLAPNRIYQLVLFDPETGLVAHGYERTAASGRERSLTDTLVFTANQEPDGDFDGLPDDVEFAVGTGKTLPDTDHDGIDDFRELREGLDPLDGRAFSTGVIANLSLPGPVQAVVADGDTVYAATGQHGLAIVDATAFNKPILLGQIDLDGTAIDVGVDGRLKLAAVATGQSLQIIDVSDPMMPVLRTSVAVAAKGVEVAGGLAFVADGAQLHLIDLLTGENLQTLSVPGGIAGLVRDGDTLYAFNNGTFSVIDIVVEGAAEVLGQLAVSTDSSDLGLFAADGVVWLAGNGLQTIDVSNPTNPTLIHGSDALIQARRIALNGSGLGMVATGVGFVDAYDVTVPTDTDAFRFRVPLSANGLDTAISRGIAYVGTGTGLSVVNYLSFDSAGQPPTVLISTPLADADGAAGGFQVFEGRDVPLRVDVTDDVQVSQIELLVNGQVAARDVAFPWEVSAVPPKLADGIDTLTLQVRATDTGGNVALSDPLPMSIIPDTGSPTIQRIDPAGGARFAEALGRRAVRIVASEALDRGSVTAQSIRLIGPGNIALTPVDIQFRSGDRVVQLTYAPFEDGEFQIVIDAAAVTDRVGNALRAGLITSAFTVVNDAIPPKIVGVNPADGAVLLGDNMPTTVQVSFSEAIDPATAAADNFRLHSAGQTVEPQSIELLNDGRDALLTYEPFAIGNFTLTVTASVTDVAGNPLEGGDFNSTFRVAAETTAPRILEVTPEINRQVLRPGPQQFEVLFSEPMAPQTITATTIPLTDSNGQPITPSNVELLDGGRRARLTYAALPVGNYTLTIDTAEVTDLAGNPVDSQSVVNRFKLVTSLFADPLYHVGLFPDNAKLADLDGDGALDLITANGGSASFGAPGFSVLHGTGDGTFQEGLKLARGLPQSALAVADLNNDGVLDLLGIASRRLTILLGTGGGRFGNPQQVAFSTFHISKTLQTGDINRDGNLDVAIYDTLGNQIEILLGTGDGTFQAPIVVDTGLSTGDAVQNANFALGDLNGDAIPDAVIVGQTSSSIIGAMSILLGNGDGTFGPHVDFDTVRSPSYVALADMNHDDKLDVVTVGGVDFSPFVTVAFGAGDGTLVGTSRTAHPGGLVSAGNALAIADFDGDGNPDVFTAHEVSFGLRGIFVAFSNSDGSFRGGTAFSTGGQPIALAAGDLNNDGKLDAVLTTFSGDNTSNRALPLLGAGNGAFVRPTDLPLLRATAVELTDLDKDGDQDIVASVAEGFDISLGHVAIFRNNGDGTFADAERLEPNALNARDIAVRDVNGDGTLDILTSHTDEFGTGGRVSVMLGDADGTYQPRVAYDTGQVPTDLELSDLDGDGDLDIAVGRNYPGISGVPFAIGVLLNNGDGTFGAVVDVTAGLGRAVKLAVGDLDGDGDIDIVTGNQFNAGISLLINNGDATFADPTHPTAPNPLGLTVADADGDSDLDILLVDTNGVVKLLANDGNGNFAAANQFVAGASFGVIAVRVGDIDGDGVSDIVAADSSGSINILYGDGGGGFFQAVAFSASAPGDLALGDLNGDRRLDFVSTEIFGGPTSGVSPRLNRL